MGADSKGALMFIIYEDVIRDAYYGTIDEYTTYESQEFQALCKDEASVEAWFAQMCEKIRHAILGCEAEYKIHPDFRSATIIAPTRWSTRPRQYTIDEVEVFEPKRRLNILE
jgi:hypothetical protein